MTTRPSFIWGLLCVLLMLLWPVAFAHAQPKPGPQAPSLNVGPPLGLQRGTSSEITLTGKNLAEPTGVLATFPGTVTIPTDNKNGEDNSKVRIQVQIPPEAPLGYHSLRLATKSGVSNLLVFCIDDLEQIIETGNNNTLASALAVKVPSVVVGKVDNLQGKYYKVTVQANQRLTFDVIARRLGSPLDPILAIYSLQTGRELAHATDTPGLQSDCRLTYTFKEAGEYVVEIKDVLNRGGGEYWYRLRIGDFPSAIVPVPLAMQRGSKATVNFAGPLVSEAVPVEVNAPADPLQPVLWVAPKASNGLHGWPVALALSDHEEKVEQEPNDELAKANRVSVPGGITGRFDKYGDKDFFTFSAKKGQKLLLEAHTLQLYSPTLVYMVLRDDKGKELAKVKPEDNPPADKRIEFTPPSDGDYIVEMQHLNYLGGPNEVYRLTITPTDTVFNLSLGLDRWDLAPGEAVALPLQINRGGYGGPIEVSAVSSHPGISGKTIIPPGQKDAALILQAKEDVPLGPYSLQLKAEADLGGRKVTELVSVAGAVSESLNKLPFPPLHLNTQLAVGVKDRPPFKLLVQTAFLETVPGLNVPVTITVQRDPGFDDQVEILPPQGLPGQAKPPAIKAIAKGQDKTSVTLPIDAKAPPGQVLVLQFTGKAKVKGKEVHANAVTGELSVGPPFALQVEPPALTLKQGEKAKLKITTARKGGYAGPVEVELTGLPAKVTANKATLAKGQDSVELEITAAADAAVGEKKDVRAQGKAPAAANQQNNSPNFTISITKKE